MKTRFILTGILLVLVQTVYAQCTPDLAYQNDTLGFYPEVSEDCGFTFKSEIEVTIVVQGVGTITLYLDAFKVTNVLNLPAGITATTDVIGSADGAAPFGYWYNTGVVPNMAETMGCVSFEEAGTTFASLANSGPNGNGTYPVTMNLDARIGGTNPDVSFLIANGTWLSNVPANLGGGLIIYERTFNANSCLPSGPCTPPAVLFAGLNTSYVLSDPPASLVGAPSGGTFYGSGISGNTFDPNVAGVGSHGITYVYTDNLNCTNAYSLCTTVDLNVSNGPETEISNNDDIEVFPNPSNGLFQISLDDVEGIVSYSVLDALGKEVASEVFVANGKVNKSLDLTDLSAGSYTLQLQTEAGVFSERLIKD